METNEIKNKVLEEAKAKRNKYPGYITDTALYYREYDDVFEVLALIPDPTIDEKDFIGREILFPKKWVTIDTISFESNEEVFSRLCLAENVGS